jgi:RNA polymerase sigma-70 factor (ECF subfamily)
MQIKYQDDYNLVHRYLTGETKAGEQLYAEVFPMLTKYVYSRTNNSIISEDDKEEIIQDVLQKSIEKLSYYNGNSKFTTYVIGIAKLKIQEVYRIKKRSNAIEVVIGEEDDILDDSDNLFNKNPLHIIIEEEQRQALETAITGLSSDHKMVLQLKMNGMKTKQIAEISGKSEEAVESMYCRAIRALRNNFQKVYN